MSLATLDRRINDLLPAVWADSTSLLMLEDFPVGTMQFFHFMPHGAVEVARIQMSRNGLIALSDLIARIVGHFPTKESIKGHAEMMAAKAKDHQSQMQAFAQLQAQASAQAQAQILAQAFKQALMELQAQERPSVPVPTTEHKVITASSATIEKAKGRKGHK